MGLDMYLYRETRKADKRFKTGYRIESSDEVCYWRKANQIRGWLVKHNVIEDDDNCVSRVIDRETIGELIDDCNRVLDYYNDAKKKVGITCNDPLKEKLFVEKARTIMPHTSGFLFGSQDFDESYIQGIEYTSDSLNTLLQSTTDDDTIVYSDWW